MNYNYIEELIAMLLHHQNQEINDIKLGVDGGQGFLKVSLSFIINPVKK